MAGGEGQRLRPLTCDIPKPMTRLCGRPILEYILELLGQNGVTQAALTLRYLPGQIIEHFPEGSYAGIDLAFVEETSPLGTAGSVKNACGSEDDNVLVISGDAMCDFDLAAFAAAHKSSGAAVSIIGKRVADPREYGLIAVDQTGRIAGFIEKPAFSQAVSDIANTGIYMLSKSALEQIPQGKKFDFAQNLFPLLLGQGERLNCWEGTGYWCDIGDLDSYIACQQDLLHGRINCNMPGLNKPGQITQGAAKITPPVYIGSNVMIEDDAAIEPGSVLDDGCTVGRGARVSGSIVLQGAHIARRTRLTGSLVCAGASVKAGAMLFEGSTVGAGAIVGEQATLAPGVKVWNHKRVEDGARVNVHLREGVAARDFFDERGITGQIGVEITPEFCARVGAALGSKNPTGSVAVGSGPGRAAEVMKAAICAGIQSTGAQAIDFGSSFSAQLEFCASFCNLEISAFIRGDHRAWIRLLSDGMPATRALERETEILISRGEFVRAPYDRVGDKVDMSGVGALYRSQLTRFASGGLTGMSVEVKSKNPLATATLREALQRLGCDVGGEQPLVIEINSQGDKLRIWDPQSGDTIRHHTILAACAAGEMERGQDIALPFDAPRAINVQANLLGRRVLRYLSTPADNSDLEARKLARTQMWSRDALMQCVIFLRLVRRNGGIKALLERLSTFEVSVRTLQTQGNPAALLRDMAGQQTGGIGEGVLVEDGKGTVLIKPMKKGGGLRILAEAVSAEIAQELCQSTEELLLGAMKNQPLE